MGPIDVTIATKNSAATIVQCIESIKTNLPHRRLIVLDDSDDSTPDLARACGAEVHHVPGLLGMKRYMQAALADTDWIASIDSDITVYPNWWPSISQPISDDVGAINGWLDSDFSSSFPAYDKYTKFVSAWRYRALGHGGAIGNTLIRRRILLALREQLMPVHAGEDFLIGQAIRDARLRWVVVPAPVGFHHHQDALAHHRMAYLRAGRSIVINKGRVRALRHFWSTPARFLLNYVRFSWHTRRLDARLFFFLSQLHGLTLRGLAQEYAGGLRPLATKKRAHSSHV